MPRIQSMRARNDVTGGASSTCGGVQAYVPVLTPPSSAGYLLRWKVEYQTYTTTVNAAGDWNSGVPGSSDVGLFDNTLSATTASTWRRWRKYGSAD